MSQILNNDKNNFKIQFNHVQLQSNSPKLQTCGKWITVFANAMFEGMTLQQFLQESKKEKTKLKISYDDIVNEIYNHENGNISEELGVLLPEHAHDIYFGDDE